MLKKFTSLLLSFAVVGMAFTGCTVQGESSQEAATQVEVAVENGESNETSEALSDTITVTDQLGREVVVPREVNRIVSSYYITSSLLIALGAEDRVVGLEMKADTREIYKVAAPEFLDLPAIGSGKSVNVEEILALDPDVVIMPYRLKEFIPQFEALNIPVIAVEPESMKNFLECVELIGTVIGAEERATELANYYTSKMEEVKALTKDVQDKPKVYMSGGSSFLTTCTANMYQNDLIEMAGGENVAGGLSDGYWANVSIEELLVWNPEYIYSVGYASYGQEEITGDVKLSNLSAVTSGNVYTFPSILEPWDYPTPSSVLGILWLVNSLHPELYTMEEYTEEAQNFYKTFFDIEVTPQDMGL
ncbi:MAG: ABC transporter substrate-binding protein [Cellulosilyticaceae bacterium]